MKGLQEFTKLNKEIVQYFNIKEEEIHYGISSSFSIVIGV